ncbi:hypothetical protein KY290_007827 [Solanum tuberosum]|uniref:DUF4283 domain-containing protein n=1 Tax=Solanum tuberosum TaxID=4113 RepID=A0ABQ7W7Z9_SOLTU|nr:hypothetical protein KY290_007827 [Solanum tuberosum]
MASQFRSASEAIETKSAIWIRLLELPTEFYNQLIVLKIGRKLGKLVKMDVCTSEALRGRYARICVEVHIGVPVKIIYALAITSNHLSMKVSTYYAPPAESLDK